MKLLITKKELDNKKSRDLIPLECCECKKTHYRTKNTILRVLNGNLKHTNKASFCSRKCHQKSKDVSLVVVCKQCSKNIIKNPSDIKSKNSFCSNSCAATYNNMYKTHGNRRSKFELWLEQELSKSYPNLEFHFNRKDSINSELDIYIPSLKLAFELNGIFHYEPIFGKTKLESIQNNDARKFQACLERDIELCIIDVSKIKYFKRTNAEEFFMIIKNIIEKKRAG
jgi:hypothetical protein